MVPFGLVFKGRFSHPLTFLGAGAKKNPHFHRIPKNAEVSQTIVYIQHHLWNVTAHKDGKPRGLWGFMDGIKWVRIQRHIPSYESTTRGQGRRFLSKGKFYIAAAEGERERISSEALQLMKSSSQGNQNCLKSRGWLFLKHLDF